MKNLKRFKELTERDVPSALDRRILAAASAKARSRHRRRLWLHRGIPTAAAAAALLIGAGIWLLPDQTNATTGSNHDLLALSDWSEMEQNTYNLSFEIYTGRQAVADLGDASAWKGI